MTAVDPASSRSLISTVAMRGWLAANWGWLVAIAALIAILLLATPAGLTVAGHRMLAVLVLAVIVWMTQALDYAVSAVAIATLMAFLLGASPQNMVAYGTETFQARDFVRTGLALTAIAFVPVMVLGAAYWRRLGYV